MMAGSAVRRATAIGLLLGTGCAPARPFAPHLRPIAKDAWDYFSASQTDMARAFERPGDGRHYQSRMDATIRNLRQAVNISSASPGDHTVYACPLFRTRLGWMYLQLGADDAAEQQFAAAVSEDRGAAEWIPGWIGWADWARRQIAFDSSKASDAERYLDEAERQLNDLVARTRVDSPRFSLLVAPGAAGPPDEGGPELTENERISLLWTLLLADEQWLDRNWMTVAPGQPAPTASVMAGGLERRLRATIAHHRAEILESRREPPAYVKAAVRLALDFDPDYFPAQLLMARQLRRDGHYQEAEAFLLPFVDRPTNLVFSNNPLLRHELALIYAGWYEQSPTPALEVRAAEAFDDLVRSFAPQNPDAWLDFARFYLLAAQLHPEQPQESRLGILRNVEECVENARRMGASERMVEELARLLRDFRERCGV